MSRPTLSLDLDPVRHGSKCPVHKSHCLALVGEAPGPRSDPTLPLYPLPANSSGGRLCDVIGLGRSGYLRAFARADLLDRYPGPTFPLTRAREAAEGLAQRLSPRPLILLGRGVAQAFAFPHSEYLTWEDFLLGQTLIRAAVIPHPSERNPWYRNQTNRKVVGDWLRKQVELHSAEENNV